MGRPNKYDTHIKPYLEQIKEWKRHGATDEQICEQLHIALSTYYDAKTKYAEFSEIFKTSKELFIADLKGELAKLAQKHKLETVKAYTRTEDGKSVTYKEKIIKEVDADVAAIHLLLKNLDRDNWANDPQTLDLRKREFELKKLIAEANNFDLDLSSIEGDVNNG